MKHTFGDVPRAIMGPNFETVYTVGLSFLRQALRWLGVAERDLDDVLQDVMLAAYRRLDTFDPTRTALATSGDVPGGERERGTTGNTTAGTAASCDPLRRWLFGIAWRQVAHYRDRAYRRREVTVGAGASWPFDPADPQLSSEQLLVQEERSQLVSRLLGAIEMDRRVILVMYELLDVPIADIAHELKLKENTVRNRLRLAREDFRIAVKRMSAEERRALSPCSALRFAERSQSLDPEAILRAARNIPEAPDAVRRRLWAALERAIDAAHAAEIEPRGVAAAHP
jgi:RNA polymerase sigma-70 factor, ECF subfamily